MKTKEELSTAITEGGVFIVNYGDCSNSLDDKILIDIREYYSSYAFP